MADIKKTSLKEAIIEAKEIEKAATEGAKKILEETLNPKLEQIVAETIKNIEESSLKEDVKIEAGSSDVEISTENGQAVVTVKTDDSSSVESINNETPEMESTEEKEEETETEEMFEVTGLNEEEVAAETEESLDDKIDSIKAQLDKLIDIVGGDEAQTSEEEGSEGEIEIIDDENVEAAPAEVPAEAPAETAPAQPTEEAPAQPTAEKPAEEVVTEDDDMFEIEFSEDETNQDENIMRETDTKNELEEIEIVDDFENTGDTADWATDLALGNDEEIELDLEDEDLISDEDLGLSSEDELEETTGASLAVNARASHTHKRDTKDGHKAPVAPVAPLMESEIKAQYESVIGELKKENEGLKKDLQDYKESFVILRKQINEVQTFNAKLAYVNKLFSEGGLTNEEKIQIADTFDKVETIEEAKKLYNDIIKEGKISKKSKIEESIKSPKISKIESSANKSENSSVLYESDEQRRMRQLAGISTKK